MFDFAMFAPDWWIDGLLGSGRYKRLFGPCIPPVARRLQSEGAIWTRGAHSVNAP